MSQSPNREKDVFLRAIEIESPAERGTFVAEACAGDDALRRRLEAMLRAYAADDSFLEKPAAALDGMDVTVDAADSGSGTRARPDIGMGSANRDGPGTRISPYKLLEQIGEGGMGVVFMAEQLEPVRRLVALKIIKPGMDGRQVLARFEAERQALAMMDHPNIAKVYDAGATPDGRPYFVMELVKGTPITRFCDERTLPTRQRLDLFVAVCQAIQHAHQKGVIHRDIKPSNVLIALYDDKPVPKVIDFGVAKATGNLLDPLTDKLTDKTLHTGFGAILGTPEYMSPEQATFNQLDIDTRSDVYSLGVLLYEMLTGTTPVDRARFRQAALLEVLRVVREEEPPRPSTRLSTTQSRGTISAARGAEPDRLARELRGELDWIVMKSLEKQRTRRYDTAAALGRDVERYLNGELVEARPPTAGYRLRKFYRRNRRTVLAAGLLLLALLAGVVGTTAGMVRAHRAQKLATQARLAAEASERSARAQALSANTARHALLTAQAMRYWEAGDAGEATRFLDLLAPPFGQAWESRFLRAAFERKFRPFALPEDGSRIGWAEPSPDGRWLVAHTWLTNEPETLHMMDARTGRTRFQFFGPYQSYAFGHDGKWVAAAGNVKLNGQQVGKVKLFDLDNGRERPTLEDQPGGVFDVEVSADDARLVLGCLDKVLLLDAGTGKTLRTLPLPGQVIRAVCSRDGKRVAAFATGEAGAVTGKSGSPAGGGPDAGTCRAWDLDGGTELFTRGIQASPYGLAASSVALSADDTQLLVAFPAETVESWDARTGTPRWTTNQVKAQYIGADFTPDGKRVVCTATDRIFLLDPATGKTDRSFLANGSHGFGRGTPLYWSPLTCMPDNRHVVVANGIWDLEDVRLEEFTAKDLSRPQGADLGHGVDGSAAFSADGRHVFCCVGTAARDTGQVHQLLSWDATSGRQDLPVTRWKGNRVNAVAFPRDGRRVALARGDGAVAVYDTQTGKPLISIAGPPDPPNHIDLRWVALSDDGTTVALSYDKQVTTWDVATGAKKPAFPTQPDGVGPVAFSSDGKLLAGANAPLRGKEFNDARAVIWDTATGRPVQSCTVPGPAAHPGIDFLAFSPDNRQLVAAHDHGTLTAWDAGTGQVLHTSTGHTDSVTALAFSPDGTRLATAGMDQTVRLWDAQTGQEVLVLKTPERAWGVAFSPDGRRLAACTGFKSVTVWAAP